MGDLEVDTTVERVDDQHFRATLSRDWEIWGPMGGYVAAVALRAAGEIDPAARPAAFSCHYLSVARFEPVDVHVQVRRRGRSASSLRVEVTQEDRAILDATVWTVGEVDGLEHDETCFPEVGLPDDLPFVQELLPEDAPRPFPFWENFEAKPIDFEVDWPPDGPRPARWREWLRFLPRATFDDPWVDAARSVILVDLPSWPAAHRAHAWQEPPYMAPTLDLNVAFHQPTAGEDWLLCDGEAPLSTGGLFGWTGRVWSPSGRLHASGGGQCLYRRLPT